MKKYISFLALSLLFLFSCSNNDKGEENESHIEASFVWTSPEMGETLESSTAIDNSNNVYIATSDGTYSYKFDGSLRWHQDTAISI
ncbi:MAG: hypothetical protein HRT66_12750, partial [Flavobacteriaceae bacterium]|nr:hypothetical protein [Flavobacteriaceae bacterium]